MRQFLTFSGRDNRLEWWAIEILVACSYQLNNRVFFLLAGDAPKFRAGAASVLFIGGLLLIGWIGLAGTVRRLHDRGKSGRWAALHLVPVLGYLWWLIECGFLKGERGANRYGRPATGGLFQASLTILFQHGPVALLGAWLARRKFAAERAAVRTQQSAPPQAGFGRRGLDNAAAAPARPALRPGTASRAGAVSRIEPRRRHMAAIVIVAIAIILGAATVFFSNFGVYAVVTPVPINPDLPVFGGTAQ